MACDARLYDRQYLAREYWDNGRSIRAIAADLGVEHHVVRRAMIAQSIPRRPVGTRSDLRARVVVREVKIE